MRVRIQKSDMAAKTCYDFMRLEERHHLLLPCRIEEEKETVCMSFDLRGMHVLEERKKADKGQKMASLLHAAELEELYFRYDFSLEPDNLYYDILGRVKVKRRDIVLPDQKDREKDFLRKYQALAGYLLDGSRPYEDYLYGGFELLQVKDKDMAASLLEPETMREEKKLLLEYYESFLESEKKDMRKVTIKEYKRLLWYRAVSLPLLIMACTWLLYAMAY